MVIIIKKIKKRGKKKREETHLSILILKFPNWTFTTTRTFCVSCRVAFRTFITMCKWRNVRKSTRIARYTFACAFLSLEFPWNAWKTERLSWFTLIFTGQTSLTWSTSSGHPAHRTLLTCFVGDRCVVTTNGTVDTKYWTRWSNLSNGALICKRKKKGRGINFREYPAIWITINKHQHNNINTKCFLLYLPQSPIFWCFITNFRLSPLKNPAGHNLQVRSSENATSWYLPAEQIWHLDSISINSNAAGHRWQSSMLSWFRGSSRWSSMYRASGQSRHLIKVVRGNSGWYCPALHVWHSSGWESVNRMAPTAQPVKTKKEEER